MCRTFGAALLVTVLFRPEVEGRPCKEFERKKEQNEHRESAIDGVHILVIPLASSVVYPVFVPDCKQRTIFFARPFHSAPTIPYTLHVIESRESSPNQRIDSNRFEIDSNGTGSVEGTNPDRNRITLLE